MSAVKKTLTLSNAGVSSDRWSRWRAMKRMAVILVAVLSGCSDAAPTSSRRPANPSAAARYGTGNTAGAVGAAGSESTHTNNTVSPNAPRTTLIGTAGKGQTVAPAPCASAQVTASRITPIVHFVIDGSSSMNFRFGSGTRWSVLRDTLIGPTGVVTTLESAVKFGMAIYSSNQQCPAMSAIAPSVTNLRAMTAAYPAVEPGVGTPTGEALQKVIDELPDFSVIGPDMMVETIPIVILATDGEPNGCSGAAAAALCDWVADLANCIANAIGGGPVNYDTTLAAVRKARDKKIPVWIVSLADGLNAIPDLQKTANIGAGLAEDASPGATIYSPQSAAELTKTLSALIGEATSCDVELAGTLDVNRACEGTVEMNGSPLACNDPNGWKPIDMNHIAVQGTACERFKSDLTAWLDARFPCDVIVPQ